MARPPTRTALVIESSLTVWSSRIGGNIPRKSSDFAKSKGGVGLSEPSSEYNPIFDPSSRIICIIAYLGRPEAPSLRRKQERIDTVEIVEDPRKVKNAYAQQYENLAREIANLVP